MATHTQPDFDRLGNELYQHWESAMTQWWDATLESPAFLGAMGANLEAGARARGQYEKAVDTSLERMHLPTRGDLVRVARVASLLEERLLEQEDHLLEMKDRMARLEREVVEARIEAAEARLETRETLAAIRAALGSTAGALAESPPVPDTLDVSDRVSPTTGPRRKRS